MTDADPTNVDPAIKANAKTADNADPVTDPKLGSEVNERLLKESKEWKQKAQAYEAQLKAKAEAEGNFKALYESAEKEKKDLKNKIVQEKVRSTVSEIAAKAGCRDVDALLKLGDRTLLQYDEETFEVLGAEAFVEQAKKSKDYLFTTAKTGVVNGAAPGGSVTQKQLTSEEIAKMKPADKAAIWAQAMSKQK